jgi:hypothetical protein
MNRINGGTMSDISSMRDDFPRTLAHAGQSVAEAAATVRRAAAEIEDGTPSHRAVKDAAMEWAAALDQLAGKGDEVHGLSRQADAPGWEAAERYAGDPNGPKWMQ